MGSKIPFVTFSNGNKFPSVGLGTWKSKPGEVKQAVKDAIDIGYRHIDCAAIYGNEKEVGAALKAKLSEGVVKRKDLYITSKLWNNSHRADLVEPALKKTLSDLGLEYLDLYLIHWPFAYKEGSEDFPTDSKGEVILSDTDYLEAYKAMEVLYEKGLIKNLGVSNFNSQQLNRVLTNSKIKPVTNQVECHPYLPQVKLSNFCKSKGVILTAYSPLGSPDRPWAKPDDPLLLDEPKLKNIAAKYKKSTAQIALRYQLQRGHIVIPKSVTKSRIQQNIEIFDFELSQEDIDQITSLDCNGRICPMPENTFTHKYYPFNIEF